MRQQTEAIPTQGALELTNGERLDSWKEIATYLRHSVRTAKRWERTENLPVHRHAHTKSASVYAYKSEIEAWRGERNPVHYSKAHNGAEPLADALQPTLWSRIAERLPCVLQAAGVVLLFNVLFRLLASR